MRSSQPSLLSSSPSIAAAFFRSSLTCSSCSTSCSWWDQKWWSVLTSKGRPHQWLPMNVGHGSSHLGHHGL